MQSYYIHLIRHGMTQGNIEGKYIGITESPLAKEGIDMLMDMYEKFKYPHVDKVYSSPLGRCIETAHLLFPQAKITTVDNISEVNFGEFEGFSAEELKNNENFQKWAADGFVGSPPNGESGDAFLRRSLEGFNQIVENMMRGHTFEAAVVTHGSVIMNIMASFCLERREDPVEWMVGNGVGYTLRITPQLWMRSSMFEITNIVPSGLYDYGKNADEE